MSLFKQEKYHGVAIADIGFIALYRVIFIVFIFSCIKVVHEMMHDPKQQSI